MHRPGGTVWNIEEEILGLGCGGTLDCSLGIYYGSLN